MLAYAITFKKKEFYSVSLVSKLDPGYNEKKIVKKHALPKTAMYHNQMLFAAAKGLLFFYSDEHFVTVFDCKKEQFQKSNLCKTDSTRKATISSLAVSQCGTGLIASDSLGDIMLWTIHSKSVDLVHCSNLSTRGILAVEFIKNGYSNKLSHAACYCLDQQIYLIDFEQISQGTFSVVLTNKFSLSGSTDITLKEYKSLGLKPALRASRAIKSFRVYAPKFSRLSDGSLVPGTQTVEYVLKDELPIETQILFPSFDVQGVLEGYNSETHTFTCNSIP